MRKLTQILFPPSILIFLLAFNFSDNPHSNWTQQFLPDVGGRQITDITFLDSLVGYATAYPDTSYILKTTNGGNNWNIIFRNTYALTRIKFFNLDTGYACGGYLYTTTNGGFNWIQINTPNVSAEEMQVLNKDTIFIIDHNGLVGGVFRTTNGGVNWTQQLNLGGINPEHIYMINGRTGFISNTSSSPYVMRTTNSGVNWTTVVSGEGFTDMHFIDILTGWRAYGSMKKTTDGGLSWVNQPLPEGGNIITSVIRNFSVLNKDTLWGVGGYKFYPGSGNRGMIYRTTNGGNNWYYQIPDTSIHINVYFFCQFTDKNHGWAYHPLYGVHTINGGDTSFVTEVKQLSSEVPKDFKLNQNYPNPFNPTTKINYDLPFDSKVQIKIFDMTGREVANIVNGIQTAGYYSVQFNASFLSSGTYFYNIIAEGGNTKFVNTKKMVLVK